MAVNLTRGTKLDWTRGYGYFHPLPIARLYATTMSPIMYVMNYYKLNAPYQSGLFST
jgi:hypothetical protein